MKLTLNWLKRHLDTTATLEKICETLTAIGLEVEGVQDRAATFAPFKVALVEKAEQHPDADRLRVCQVKTADGTLQVVCGAPNARAGMKGIFAPDGAYIPGLDVTLKKTKIRGVESNGMLVSEREMSMSDEHNGIIEVDEGFEIGTPMAQVFGLDDPIIEINVTPNRPDCAGVRGVARDLAAAGLGTLKPIDILPAGSAFKSPVGVKIEDEKGCPVFCGRLIRGVKNGQSPKWMQDYLKSVGQKSISALVDITNFMSLDQCRPLHVYDADKLKGGISVCPTRSGESFEALNGKTYNAPAGAVGICDERGLIGLGGIMGGASTGCDENTQNVFLESAYFDPIRIARTGRDLQITSDARYRFERGIDTQSARFGLDFATRLILEICGGTASDPIQTGNPPPLRDAILYSTSAVQKLIGVDIDAARQIEILTALGFVCEETQEDSMYQITIPTWRGDVNGTADIVEEVIRIAGYDLIPSVSVRGENAIIKTPQTPLQTRIRAARGTLAARGMQECVTWSFLDQKRAGMLGSNDNAALALSNPISTDLSQMRPSILPNLLAAAQGNFARGLGDGFALFEVGPIFNTPEPDGQAHVAAGIRAGQNAQRHWSASAAPRSYDAFDAKGDVTAILLANGVAADMLQITRDAPAHFHGGRSGVMRLGKAVLAHFGEIHPAVLAEHDIKFPVAGFEVFLDALPAMRKKAGSEKPLLKLETLQPVHRDFAFIVGADVEADSILRAARAAEKALITKASVFDVYAGKGVEDGKKSVAITVTLQPVKQTMTDADIEAVCGKIIDGVGKKTGATLRGG